MKLHSILNISSRCRPILTFRLFNLGRDHIRDRRHGVPSLVSHASVLRFNFGVPSPHQASARGKGVALMRGILRVLTKR
jgi:hypothetical protein